MRFMLVAPQALLFKLRKKLYFDEFSHEDINFAYSADLSIENVLNRLIDYLGSRLIDEYASVYKSSSILIIEQFSTSFGAIMNEFNDMNKVQNNLGSDLAEGRLPFKKQQFF